MKHQTTVSPRRDPEPIGDVLALCAFAGEPANVSGLRSGWRRATFVAILARGLGEPSRWRSN
jgi:hypothetical protein